MTLDRSQSKLYVAQDNADQVAVIDTSTNAVTHKIDARAPAGMLAGRGDEDRHEVSFGREFGREQPHYTGAATFSVTISPDGTLLYAVNAGANSVAVIPLTGPAANKVIGLIPTAYEPHDVTFSADGSWIYVVNGKSATGPNPDHLYGNTALLTSITYPQGNAAAAAAAAGSNQYQFQLERASLVSAPVPTWNDLPVLTAKVAQNNFYSAEPAEDDEEVVRFLRQRIKHVIYIIKENRTFDQVLGDLNNGSNGDPGLTVFGAAITPNFHSLAKNFVTLDNLTGAQHINLNTAFQRPMSKVFDIRSFGAWSYTATASTVLLTTSLKLAQGKEAVKFAQGPIIKPKHSAAYWARVTAGFDFSDADRVPPAKYNKVLWKGLMGSKPYPKMALDQRNKVDNDD